MNDIFSFNRFWHLCRKTVFENWLVFVGTMALMSVIFLYFFGKAFKYNIASAQHTIYPIMIFSGTILTSLLMNQFSPKSKPISYLTFPASVFEKWLVIFVLGVVLHFFVFIGIYKIFLEIFVNMAKNNPQPPYGNHEVINPIETDYAFFQTTNYFYFVLQAFAMVVCLYFNRNAYVKGVILAIFLTFFGLYLNSLIGNIFFGDGIKNMQNFEGFQYVKSGKIYFLALPKETSDPFMFFFKHLLAPILFAISYVRLKEKEA